MFLPSSFGYKLLPFLHFLGEHFIVITMSASASAEHSKEADASLSPPPSNVGSDIIRLKDMQKTESELQKELRIWLRLEDIFQEIDEDASGEITISEFQHALEKHGIEVPGVGVCHSSFYLFPFLQCLQENLCVFLWMCLNLVSLLTCAPSPLIRTLSRTTLMV